MGNNKPKVTTPAPPSIPTPTPPTTPDPAKDENAAPQIENMTITVPVSDQLSNGYISRHVEVNRLTTIQKEVLHRITRGLMCQGATLENGQLVKSNADSIRFILENMKNCS